MTLTHNKKGKYRKYLRKLQIFSYWIYILSTAIFLIGTILVGYLHLRNIDRKSVYKDFHIEEKAEFSKKDETKKESKPTAAKPNQKPKQISVINTKTQT